MSLNVNCPCGSGNKFDACHGGTTPQSILSSYTAAVPVEHEQSVPADVDISPGAKTYLEFSSPVTAPVEHAVPVEREREPQLAKPLVTRKLDLACGQSPIAGYEGVDLYAGANHVVNLLKFPWPFEDNSVAELHSSHFIEHIPMVFVDKLGNPLPANDTTGQDLLLRFFDECYRILVPNGHFRVQWPALRSSRAFQDPTHRRFIPEETLLYLNAEWRKSSQLDHYNVLCHFVGNVGHTFDSSLNKRTPEVIREYLLHRWNHAIDFIADLTAVK